jgi:hypothetical protein
MIRTLRHLFVTAVAACGVPPSDGAEDAPVCEAPGALDDVLRVSHLQGLGTHNSYHLRPDVLLSPSWDYAHPPLGEQVALWGVRQVELDVHRSVDGGWEVFHLPGIDSRTTCPRLADCLRELEAWSRANPCHAPLMVWIEPKDDIDSEANGYLPLLGWLDELDAEILEVWPRSRVITPDDVRGPHPDLPTAVRTDGWPTLAEARGRAIFALLDTGELRDDYLGDDPTLAGRVLFADADSSDPAAAPWAAAFKIDDAVGEAALVASLVAEGFLVTSNADSADGEPAANRADWEGSLAAGANWLSSDFADAPAEAAYRPVVPGGAPLRCNPVSAPEGCTSEAIERLP